MRKIRFAFQDDATSFPEYRGELAHRRMTEEEVEKIDAICRKWIRYDTVTIEIDLDTDSFRIVPLDEPDKDYDYANSYPYVPEVNRIEPEFEAWEEEV